MTIILSYDEITDLTSYPSIRYKKIEKPSKASFIIEKNSLSLRFDLLYLKQEHDLVS